VIGICSDKDNHMHRVPKSMFMHFFVSLPYWRPLLNYSCDSKFSVGLDMAQASQSPASHRGGPSSIPDQSMWDLWWTKWQWDGVFSQYFRFLLSV